MVSVLKCTKNPASAGAGQAIVVMADDDPELQAYLEQLRNDPAFDHSRRRVIERLERAGITLGKS